MYNRFTRDWSSSVRSLLQNGVDVYGPDKCSRVQKEADRSATASLEKGITTHPLLSYFIIT